MYKIENITPSKEHVEKFGNFNQLPPNFRQITESELIKNTKFFSTTPEYIEYRQPTPDNVKDTNLQKFFTPGVYLYFYRDGTGVGISSSYHDGKVYYFKFALCDHKYYRLSSEQAKEKNIYHYGMFCNVYECTHCGLVKTEDSSG